MFSSTEVKTATVQLEYLNYVQNPPIGKEQLLGNACRSDDITFKNLGESWVENTKKNKAKFNSFKDKSIGKFFGKHKNTPIICAGSGPSLAKNGEQLKNRGDIPLISCLHNFHFFEDRDIPVDYYVTLDAGPLTVEEVYEGGKNPPEWYWERTKGKILFAYIGANPTLLEKWQGDIYFYNCPAFSHGIGDKINAIEKFNLYVVSGGNVLGACVYIGKAILGCNPIAFVGADFSFSYDKKFHAWNSKYDKDLGNITRTVDVYGQKIFSWNSYLGFKNYFEWMSMTVPGLYINCTEGGVLGSFYEGNIMSIQQMDLKTFFVMYQSYELLRDVVENPELDLIKVLY